MKLLNSQYDWGGYFNQGDFQVTQFSQSGHPQGKEIHLGKEYFFFLLTIVIYCRMQEILFKISCVMQLYSEFSFTVSQHIGNTSLLLYIKIRNSGLQPSLCWQGCLRKVRLQWGSVVVKKYTLILSWEISRIKISFVFITHSHFHDGLGILNQLLMNFGSSQSIC